jgi:hypothetical protein
VVSESERRESKEGKANNGKIVIDKRTTVHPSEQCNHKWVIKQPPHVALDHNEWH